MTKPTESMKAELKSALRSVQSDEERRWNDELRPEVEAMSDKKLKMMPFYITLELINRYGHERALPKFRRLIDGFEATFLRRETGLRGMTGELDISEPDISELDTSERDPKTEEALTQLREVAAKLCSQLDPMKVAASYFVMGTEIAFEAVGAKSALWYLRQVALTLGRGGDPSDVSSPDDEPSDPTHKIIH
jgi:hypothetical protein